MPDDRDGYLPQVVQRQIVRCAACGKPWPTALAALFCERTDDLPDDIEMGV